MRLWSLHPKYLDAKGLVALWREGLLAKKVLEDATKGYRNHPQLHRFKSCTNPLVSINSYLHIVCDEAEERDYSFDRSKLSRRKTDVVLIKVTSGQVEYEWSHLMRKLEMRDPKMFAINREFKRPRLHPLFKRVTGGIESWEIINE